MSDMISREEAIDSLTNLTCYGIEEMENLCSASVADSEGWIGGILEAIHELQALPSAEPERVSMVWKPADGRPAYEKGVCSCGYVLSVLQRDFVYCPLCGCRLEWE